MIMAAVVLSVIGLALTLALCRASPTEGAVVGERAGAERRRRKREWRALLANLFEPSQSGHVPSAHFLLAIAVRLLPPSEHERYLEEFRAELLDVPRDTQLRHALSLLRGAFVVRLRRGLKKAADAAAGGGRRASS